MRLIKHFFLLQVILLLFLLLGCGSEGGTDPKSVLDSDGTSSEIASFDGKWSLYEKKQDCNSESSQTDQTELLIVQNKDKATLLIASAVGPIDCDVVQTELHCAGTMAFKNGEEIDFEAADFWYDENQNLQGEAVWTRVDADQNKCKGSSEFSSTSPVDTDTETVIGIDTDTDINVENFNGRWIITDSPEGCFSSVRESEYRSVIDHSGANATITTRVDICPTEINAQCTISGNVLSCDLFDFYDNAGRRHLYTEFVLRYVANDRLNGTNQWSIYSDIGKLICSGTSRVIGVREENETDAQEQP